MKKRGTTDKKFNDTQRAAMHIVARWGVKNYDALPDRNSKNRVSTGWRTMLEQERGIGMQSARQHIARAIRRQRNPDWNGDFETAVLQRGGNHENSGRNDVEENQP